MYYAFRRRCRTRRSNGSTNVFTVTMQNSLNSRQVAVIQGQNSFKRKIIDGFLKNFTNDSKKKPDKHIRESVDFATCPICCEDYKDGNLEILIALLSSCGHFYHFDCIWSWLVERSVGTGECSCPLCRTNVEFNIIEKRVGLRVFKLEDVLRSRDECRGKYSSTKRARQPSSRINDGFEVDTEDRSHINQHPTCVKRLSHNHQNIKKDTLEIVKVSTKKTDATNERFSEKTCHVCKRDFSGDPTHIIVGYITSCGHFYHYDCILNEKSKRCPRCLEQGESVPDFKEYEILTTILADILEERQRTTLSACTVCNREFGDETTDNGMGLIEGCGHYYHIRCLKKIKQCPQCVAIMGDRAIDLKENDYTTILLSDISSMQLN